MLKDIKKTAQHSIVYALGNMGMKVVGFLLIPFYTNPELLSTSDYGAFAVLEGTLQLLIGVLAFAMPSSLARWYWEKEYEKDQKSIFFTTFAFLWAIIIPSAAILCYFSEELSNLIFNSVNYGFLITLTIITAALQVINNLVFMLLRLRSKSIYSVTIQTLKFIGLLFLVIWGLKVKHGGLLSIIKAYFYVETFVLILLIPTIIKNSRAKINFKVLREMISYGFPLMLASVSGVLLMVTDRYMLNSMEGLEKTAVYSVGTRIAHTLKMIITSSLTLGLLPLQMKKIGTKGSERFYSKAMKYSSYIFAIALLFLSLFSLEILKVITGSDIYLKAHGIVAVISFALLFGQLKNDSLMGITIKKKTKVSGSLVIIASIINIGLNVLLIPVFDIYGAAFATLISQLLFFVSIYIAAQKLYYIPYEIKNVVGMVIMLAIFVVGGLATSDLDSLYRLPIKSILFITFPFSLLVFGYYDNIEKERIKELFKAWRNPKKLKENLQRFLK